MEKTLTTKDLLAKAEQILRKTYELWTKAQTEASQETRMVPSNLKPLNEKERSNGYFNNSSRIGFSSSRD